MNTIMKIILDRYLLIALGFLPIALITGPLIPEIIIGFINIILLIQIKNRNNLFFENFYFKFFILICGFMFVRNFFSDFFDKNFLVSIFYFRFGLFALAIFLLISYNKNIKSFLFYTILISYLVLTLDSSYEYLLEDRIIGNKSMHQARISSFFGNEYIMGSYVVRLLPFILFLLLWIKKDEIFKTFLGILILFLASLLIILSGERTALGLLLLIIVSLFFIKSFRYYLNCFLVFFVFLIFVLFKDTNIKDRYTDFARYNSLEKKEFVFFTPEHHSMMLTSIKIFKNNFFFGHGGKAFKYLCEKNEYTTITYPQGDLNKKAEIGCSNHPHNIILQIIVEYGILGFLIYLYIISKVFLNLCKNIIIFNTSKKKISKNIYLSNFFLYLSVLVNVFPFFPSGNLFNNWLSILIFLPIGFITEIKKK